MLLDETDIKLFGISVWRGNDAKLHPKNRARVESLCFRAAFLQRGRDD